jgi:hypothetical protein
MASDHIQQHSRAVQTRTSIDEKDLDPWTAWAYRPRTLTVLLLGAGLLVQVWSSLASIAYFFLPSITWCVHVWMCRWNWFMTCWKMQLGEWSFTPPVFLGKQQGSKHISVNPFFWSAANDPCWMLRCFYKIIKSMDVHVCALEFYYLIKILMPSFIHPGKHNPVLIFVPSLEEL